MKTKSEFLKKLETRQRKANRAWRQLVEAFNMLHHKCPGKAKPLYKIMESYLIASDDMNELLLIDSIERRHAILPHAMAGAKVFRVQADRRAEWSRKRNVVWAEWQNWINDTHKKNISMGLTGNLPSIQRQAAKHFKVDLKSIKRRTERTWTS